MDKPIYQSWTFWGMAALAAGKFVESQGIVPDGVLTGFLEASGTFLAGMGIRRALK